MELLYVFIPMLNRKFKALASINGMLRVIMMMARRKARLKRKGENFSKNNATAGCIVGWCCVVSFVVTVLKVSFNPLHLRGVHLVFVRFLQHAEALLHPFADPFEAVAIEPLVLQLQCHYPKCPREDKFNNV